MAPSPSHDGNSGQAARRRSRAMRSRTSGPREGCSPGSKLYYRVELETTAGKKHAIATQLDNLRLAKRFITEITEQLTA